MRKVAIVVCSLVLVALGILWWRHGKPTEPPQPSQVTQPGSNPAITTNTEPSAQVTLIVDVSDAAGPLAHARVRIAPAEGDVIVLETDAKGAASTKLPPGGYTVSASAKDHEPIAHPLVKLASGKDQRLALLLVAGGRPLSGLVTDVSGGPIGGVRIDAAKLSGIVRPGAAVATTLTGTDGRYSMTVAEGQLLVAAHSPDYAAQSRYVEVGSAGATADFSLVPGGVIEGVVIDDRGKAPVAGALVMARRDSASIMLAEGGGSRITAGPDGRFRITGLRPGAYELTARFENRRTRTPTMVGLGVAEQVTDVQLLIGKNPTVRGVVSDETGAPVVGAAVGAIENFDDDVKTDAKGAFAIEGLETGTHALIATADAYVFTSPVPVAVADKDVDGVVIRMKKAAKLTGHVEPRQAGCDIKIELDETTNMPIASMMLAPATTGTDGAFEIGPMKPGKLEVSARCTSTDQGRLALTWNPGDDVVLAVTPGASIAGKVIDGDGKPVAGATVMASATGGTVKLSIVNGMVTSGIQGITGAAGNYELTGLTPGPYRMTALDRGRPLRSRKPPPSVTLAASEHKTSVDLAIDRPNGVIKGTVTGPDGKPLADAWVSVHQDLDAMIQGAMGPGGPGLGPKPGPGPGPGPGSGAGEPDGERRFISVESHDEGGEGGAGEFPPALTDAQGRFEIAGLPHMSFDVVAEAQAGKLRGRADAVTPDATITLKTLGVTSLSGTVRGANGPAGLFTVELDGPTKTQRSFTDGTFSLGRVDPGNYTVRVRSTDGNGEASVVVAPNTPATVDIVLVANAIIVGTIVDQGGKPVPDIQVTVLDDTGDGRIMISSPPPTTGPDGKFRIEHKAGKGMLVVLVPPRPVMRPGLVLEPGKTLDVGAIPLGHH